jgi:hypothetical protein
MFDPDRPISAPTLIKKMLLSDPDLTVREIDARLREQDIKITRITISTIKSGFRHTLKVLIDLGLVSATVLEPKEPAPVWPLPRRATRQATRKRRAASKYDDLRPRRRPFREWNFSG